MSDGEAVLHGRMPIISCRCILEMLDGETESTLVGDVEGEGIGCLEGGITEGVGLGFFVGF